MAEVLYSVLGKVGWAHAVKPDGHEWGRAESLPKFVVVKFPGVSVEDCAHFTESTFDAEGGHNGRRWILTPGDLPLAVRQQLATSDIVNVGGGDDEISWNELESAIKDSGNASPGRPAGLPVHADRNRSTAGAPLIAKNPGPGFSGLAAFRSNEFAANLTRRAAYNNLARLKSHGGTPEQITAARGAANAAESSWIAEKQTNGTLSQMQAFSLRSKLTRG